jgi:hypothetical protein
MTKFPAREMTMSNSETLIEAISRGETGELRWDELLYDSAEIQEPPIASMPSSAPTVAKPLILP